MCTPGGDKIHSANNSIPFLPLYLCIRLYLSACLSFCFFFLCVFLPLSLSGCLSLSPSTSICLSFYLSVCLSVCLSLSLSHWLPQHTGLKGKGSIIIRTCIYLSKSNLYQKLTWCTCGCKRRGSGVITMITKVGLLEDSSSSVTTWQPRNFHIR